MALLDSDILVGLMREDQDALKKIGELERNKQSLATTHFSEFELFVGAFESARPEVNFKKVSNLLSDMGKIPFEETAPKIAAKIFHELKKRGNLIGAADIFIAAVALAGNEVLVTRNSKHFSKIPGLEIEGW